MAGTFQTRVQSYLGTGYAETATLSDNLTAGAKYIADLLPIDKLKKFVTDFADIGSGVSVAGMRLLGAHKSYIDAFEIPKGLKTQASDSASLYYATSTSPVYYIDGGKAYVLPSGGSVVGYTYPTVAYSDTVVASFPNELDHAVVLYAVIQGCIDLINDSRVSLDALSYTSPTTTIDGTIWATAYPNYATQIGTALTAVTTQLGAGVTTQGNVATLLSTTIPTAIGLGNAEVDLAKTEVAKMDAEIVLADAQTALATTAINIAVGTALSAITTASGRINTAVALANTEFDKVAGVIDLANVEFDKIAAQLATASTTITTAQDLEKGKAQIEQAGAIVSNGESYLKEANERISNGNSYLEEAKTSFQEVQGYVSEVSSRIGQVQGFLAVSNADLSSAQAYSNVAQGYLGTANGYFLEAQRNLDIAQAYSQSVNNSINLAQGYTGEVQARLANVDTKVSEYNSKAQEALAKYQADQQRLTSEINHFQLILTSAKKEFEDYLRAIL